MRNKLSMVALTILLVVWLQSASILSKAFTGILLNTYFNIKTFPIVDNIHDIFASKDISIAIGNDWFYSHSLPSFNRSEQKLIRKHIKKYINVLDEQVLVDVIMGRTVIMCTSTKRDEFYLKYRLYQDKFAFSKKKYVKNYASYNIRKRLYFKSILVKL